jgi:hypothetical protein
MGKLKYIILTIAIINMGGLNCKEVYLPPVIQNSPHFLVVDGIVINGNDSTIITLSHTRTLNDSAPATKELNAHVSVINGTGSEYPLTETGNGQYAAAQFLLNAGQQYQLKIITSDGNEFRSELSSVHISPPIDSVYWNQDSAGVHIYLDSHDPGNNTRYYRWQNVETWEYHAAFDSYLIYIDENNIIFRDLNNQIFKCYQMQVSPSIAVATTSRLTSDILNKYEVIFIPAGSEKITAEYSDLISQYAISADAFNFWENLKKNTEQLGTLFDFQPFTEFGNIQCVNNPAIKCIGYISFTTAQKKRILINYKDVNSWNYTPYYKCSQDTIRTDLVSQVFQPAGGPYFYSLIGQTLDTTHTPVYLFAPVPCVDCRLHGGSTIKPAFWP